MGYNICKYDKEQTERIMFITAAALIPASPPDFFGRKVWNYSMNVPLACLTIPLITIVFVCYG